MSDIITLIEDNPNFASAIAALMAVIVSFISIILAVLSLWFQRRHNLKSVTPIASIDPSDYENLIAVRIRNSGTGPLVISKFIAVTTSGVTADDLISLMPSTPEKYSWDTYHWRLENVAIVPSESITLLEFSGDKKDPVFCGLRDKIRRHLMKTTVTLKYKDIYGRKMSDVQKELDSFARHLSDEKEAGDSEELSGTFNNMNTKD